MTHQQRRKGAKGRVAVATLVMSMAGFAAWKGHEGFEPKPMIPTKGDVPTIGYGSTRWEDGTRVKMSDAPIDRGRAAQLAWALNAQEEVRFRASMPNASLTQGEYDAYMDFVGQYGMGNWNRSSMRRNVIAGRYQAACNALLNYKYAAGYDCSTLVNGKPNKRCWGVWERQLKRYNQCTAEQQ